MLNVDVNWSVLTVDVWLTPGTVLIINVWLTLVWLTSLLTVDVNSSVLTVDVWQLVNSGHCVSQSRLADSQRPTMI